MSSVRNAIVAALLIVAGCGGGGGGGHGSGGDVATPAPTPTAGASNRVSLTLALTTTADVVAASFTVGYEAGRGSFAGSGAQAQCRLASSDTLAVNDDDAGTLRVAILPADPVQRPTIAVPTTLTCEFDQTGGTVTSGDLRITNKKVAVLDTGGVAVAGDPARLDVR